VVPSDRAWAPAGRQQGNLYVSADTGRNWAVTLMLDDGTKIPVTAIVRPQEVKQ
jgi:hypothetical protein